MTVSFIGVDLAWCSKGRNSGLAAFRGDGRGADPVQFGSGVTSLCDVMEFILAQRSETTVVAIDAPLIVRNAEGQRRCETLISQQFGFAHAGAHSTNLKRYPNAASIRLAACLKESGFRHCTPPGEAWDAGGHWFFEVYPHPAQVRLFERRRIIKYKQGRVVERRQGLQELRGEIQARLLGPELLRSSETLLEFLAQDLDLLRGAKLKGYEDALDAIVCCYLAFHLWRWGWDRSDIFGDLDDGYIVVPKGSSLSLHLDST